MTNLFQSQHPFKHRLWMGISAIGLIMCGLLGFATTIAAALLLNYSIDTTYEVVDTNRSFYARSAVGPNAAVSELSNVFTDEIQYWEPWIKSWAVVYQVDPNLIATLIQIESCGDPMVSSPAGAQGLFQVMPFHFDTGEDMLDVTTNARRGMAYLVGGLERSEGHVGLALAGYNGGHGVIARGWAAWPSETQRYYYWGSRIYAEAIAGMETSATLDEWLATGGARLCAQASNSIQQIQLDDQARSAAQAAVDSTHS